MYDLIGDIHGYAAELEALLQRMGYERRNGAYRHAERKAIFLGDFIDRGPGTQETMAVVRAMLEADSAMAVMGNHELNALAYHTPHPERAGEHLRPRNPKNTHQHQATLDQLAGQPPDSMLEWFYSLPLWLDLGPIRVVHACWDEAAMRVLKEQCAIDSANRLKPSALHAAATRGHSVFKAVEILLKGMEVQLPDGITYMDKEGNERSEIRIRWWDASERSNWRELVVGEGKLKDSLPADKGPEPRLTSFYPQDAPPVFVGHYWMSGEPDRLAPNVACVDYSVAKPQGVLAAYRWDGEQTLSKGNFVSVARI